MTYINGCYDNMMRNMMIKITTMNYEEVEDECEKDEYE